MVDRVSGAPAIQEPRAGATGAPSADLRALQVTIQNIRERLRLLEAVLNQLISFSTGTGSGSANSGGGGRAAGPPGAVQFADITGALAGVVGMTYEPTSGTFDVDGMISHASRQVQEGIQWQDEGIDLGPWATVNKVNFIGDGVFAYRVGDTVFVEIGGVPSDKLLAENGDYLITESGVYIVLD